MLMKEKNTKYESKRGKDMIGVVKRQNSERCRNLILRVFYRAKHWTPKYQLRKEKIFHEKRSMEEKKRKENKLFIQISCKIRRKNCVYVLNSPKDYIFFHRDIFFHTSGLFCALINIVTFHIIPLYLYICIHKLNTFNATLHSIIKFWKWYTFSLTLGYSGTSTYFIFKLLALRFHFLLISAESGTGSLCTWNALLLLLVILHFIL